MKTRKRFVALAVALVLVATVLALPASAKMNDSSSVQRVPICPSCGEPLYVKMETVVGDWEVTTGPCRHYEYGTDITYTRVTTTSGYCRNCDFLAVLPKTTTERKVVCNGYN